MRLYQHEGCRSGTCAWQSIGMLLLELRSVTDATDRGWLQRQLDERVAEASRLLEDAQRMGISPPAPDAGSGGQAGAMPALQSDEVRRTLAELRVGDWVRARFHDDEGCGPVEGEIIECVPPFVAVRQGGGSRGGIVKEIERKE
jgi:hypothetical protein